MSLAAGLLALAPGAAQAATETHTFPFTGMEQKLVVPDGVPSVHFVVVGADGGSAAGAVGGDGFGITGDIEVQAGETLYVEVGGKGADASSAGGTGFGGFNGGGDGGVGAPGMVGAGGGGATDIRTLPRSDAGSAASRILVAPGGGGATSGTSGGAARLDGAPGHECTDSEGGLAPTPGPPAFPSQPGYNSGGCNFGAQGGTGTFVAGGDGGGNGRGPVEGGGGGGGGYYGGGGGGQSGAIPGDSGSGAGGGWFYSSRVTLDAGNTGLAGSAAPSVVLSFEAPTAAPSPTKLAFGTQALSTVSAAQAVTLTNSGSAPLHVGGETFTGPNAGAFLVSSSTCARAVPVGSSCALLVRFAPQGAGPNTATLNVLFNSASSPTQVALSGTGGSLPAGPTGPAGPAGPGGSAGPAGPSGPAGPAGPKGPTGPAGGVGPSGSNGSAGPTGPAGPQGPAGPAGERGSNGSDGSDGSAGPAGPQGPRGPAGDATCRVSKLRVTCGVRFVVAPKRVSARLERRGVVYARGKARHGSRALRLRAVRPISPGRYTLRLTVVGRHGKARRVAARVFVR